MTATMVPHFQPYHGAHCETAATGSLLKAIGIDLSEPMLFGLAEGLNFVFLNLTSLPLPFVGGRVKPFELTQNLCRQLGVHCHVTETSSIPKSWSTLEAAIAKGQPVGLQLDAYYLDYFSIPFHFAGHCVAAYGFDEQQLWLVDTIQQGPLQQVSRFRVQAARFEKGPMSAKARAWTIEGKHSQFDMAQAILKAVRSNANCYLAPPFQGASYLGIRKLANSLPKWRQLSQNPGPDLHQAALLMERAGTGGAIFRNFYRDFLLESSSYIHAQKDQFLEAAALMANSASGWTEIANCLEVASAENRTEPLQEAALLCLQIADLEVAAMQLLAGL